MSKSTSLNFTQNLNNAYADFCSADVLQVISVSPNNAGTTLTDGIRTFTAAAGTLVSGASAASWTATILGGRVIGMPVIVEKGQYTVTPTAAANAATVDTGSTNATFNLVVEFFKELYTSATNDSVVKAINVASFDSTARVMKLWIISTDAQPILIGAVNIPANSGNNGAAAAVDLLGGTLMPSLPYDANGKRVIALRAGQKLAVSVPLVTAGTQINVTAQVEEY